MSDKAIILVVDDSLVNLAALNEILEQQGFSVLLANSGQRAITVAKENRPDLILLDVVMPGWDGYETCKQMKADSKLSNIPILFISGLGDTQNKIKAFQAGAVDYVSKPFQNDELFARVTTHIELSKLRSNLEKEVENQTAKIRSLMNELQLSYQKAHEVSVLKTQFLRNISHEFRTPMNIILGVTEEMVQDTPMNDEQVQMAEEVLRSGKLLLGILDNMLRFAEQFSGELIQETSSFEIRELINDCINNVTPPALSKKLALHQILADDLPTVKGNYDHLREILNKFLENAIKFTPAGKVEVKTEVVEDFGKQIELRFTVTDTGIGINLDQQERLFQSFSQGDGSTTREYGGLGMGLALAKLYCDNMGGEIGVDSTIGKGSSFWFQVPLEKVS
jgi:two-component system, sensor histidine kinase and response regulator